MKKFDWRDPNAYKFRHGLWTQREFYAWEFLRRNTEYRTQWKMELGNYTKKEEILGDEYIDPENP